MLAKKISERIVRESPGLEKFGVFIRLDLQSNLIGKSAVLCDEIMHRLPEMFKQAGDKWKDVQELHFNYSHITNEGLEYLVTKILPGLENNITSVMAWNCPNITPKKVRNLCRKKVHLPCEVRLT